MPEIDYNHALDPLLQKLREDPSLWDTRKEAATLLHQKKQYLEAADIIWNAPEIPSTDVDVAFAIKIISRVKPNRSIRLIYEVIRRNSAKPVKNLAVARALNDIGMFLEAARFYGAAVAIDSELFDLSFERQMLWMDDSGKLMQHWQESENDPDSTNPLDIPEQDLGDNAFTPNTMPNAATELLVKDAPEKKKGSPPPITPIKSSSNTKLTLADSSDSRPLMVAGGSSATSPLIKPSETLKTTPLESSEVNQKSPNIDRSSSQLSPPPSNTHSLSPLRKLGPPPRQMERPPYSQPPTPMPLKPDDSDDSRISQPDDRQ